MHGVLKALEENNIKIDIIGGTSSGSLIASLYAMGYEPYYIYTIFKRYAREIAYISNGTIVSEVRRFVFTKKIKTNGIKDGKELEDVYDKLALKKGIKKMNDIEMPLVIPAVDISESKEYVFSSVDVCLDDTVYLKKDKYISDISVGKAIRSSSSFPIILNPCEYKDHIFADGGILNNIPVNHIRNMGADKILSIKFDSSTVDSNSNVMDIIMKTVDIMGNKLSEKNLQESDYVLTIPSNGTGLLDTSKIEFCYSAGYSITISKIEEIKESLKI